MVVYQYAIFILFGLAISDLIVGVSNDAVNFLNSSVGSRVAPRRVIMIVASLGILAGVTFSSGMMEVARKGIFHPQFFTMPELMMIFLAVMLTDIILLDLFNTFGLPTSTTVSIVFELLGAAVAVSMLKLYQAGSSISGVGNYINTGKAMTIIFGILLSVAVAFGVGAIVQFLSRILFTFDYEKRLRRYGALWGGLALASITYFILIKGSKGASFITDETLAWIQGNTGLILLMSFGFSAIFLQALLIFTRVHILKVVVLAGTFALAMAFAANDLVNFIGVPLAGLSAYTVAGGSGDFLGQTMEALRAPVRANTLFLLVAGGIMVATLWISRKSRSVTKTVLSLGRQEEGYERFESTLLSQTIVRIVAALFANVRRIVPGRLREAVNRRLDRSQYRPVPEADGSVPSFDLLRAAVDLMVASALIAWATSLKLPLSTTYVTFMVAMGTSLSDQAWGRDSAVYRVTGVLTVIGGWFFTATMAFTVSLLIAVALYFGGAPVVVAILALAVVLVVRTHLLHRGRAQAEEAAEVFNLRKISDSPAAVRVTFEHAGIFLQEVSRVLTAGFDGLVASDRQKLKSARAGQRRIQIWSNIIVANIFKVLRLLQWEDVKNTQHYAQTISTLQEISESTRDIVMRSNFHVANNHSRLLDAQVAELRQIRQGVLEILDQASKTLLEKEHPDPETIKSSARDVRKLTHEFDQNQIMRIQNNSSKTRLSILFYAFMWDSLKIAEQTTHLLTVFQDPMRPTVDLDRAGEPSAHSGGSSDPDKDAETEPEKVKA
jgi:phosphate/sulfate permease